ncbi:MAG: (d)CMP kinase, partial [Buchnera aphidicola]|nr:(d)CMP kinase [Buchnera aphidicola]
KKNGYNTNYQKLLKDIKNLNSRDKNRLISPLYPSKNAIMLNSTSISILNVVNITMMHIKQRIENNL